MLLKISFPEYLFLELWQVKVVWGALGSTLGGSGGALGEFWEALYIKKLPINRPCGRYVNYHLLLTISNYYYYYY